MRRALVLPALLALGLVSAPSSAQVNVETLRGTLRPYEVQAGLEWSFTGRAGNTQGMDGGGAGKFLYSLGRHNFFGFGSLDYTRLNKQLQVSRRWAHLRYEYVFSPLVSGETFAQTQSDAIRRLALRQLVGVGPRVRVLDDEGKTAAIGVGPMFELERVRVAPGATDEPQEINHRVNAYVSVLWKIDPRVSWNAVAYFQPRWDAPKDFRLLFDGGLIFAITKRLSAKLIVGVRHDNRPPTGVLPTDAELKNALALTLLSPVIATVFSSRALSMANVRAIGIPCEISLTTSFGRPAASTPKETSMSAILFISHEVKDFAAWKPGFDSHAGAREAAGIKVLHLTQDAKNPNLVHGVMEAPSAEVFEQFLSNPGLQEAMAKGGVIGRPEARIGIPV